VLADLIQWQFGVTEGFTIGKPAGRAERIDSWDAAEIGAAQPDTATLLAMIDDPDFAAFRLRRQKRLAMVAVQRKLRERIYGSTFSAGGETFALGGDALREAHIAADDRNDFNGAGVSLFDARGNVVPVPDVAALRAIAAARIAELRGLYQTAATVISQIRDASTVDDVRALQRGLEV